MHLVIDGYGGDRGKMWDESLVRNFLSEYPAVLGMTKICEPRVLTYDAPDEEDSGVSGFVIIAESHISIHTFPNREYANVDVFSCKSFDRDRAYDDIVALFNFSSVNTWNIDRGLEFLDPQPGKTAFPQPAQERPAGATPRTEVDPKIRTGG